MPREQQVEQNIEPPYVRQLSDEDLEELLLAPTKTRVPSLSHAVGSTCGKATTETAAAVTGAARQDGCILNKRGSRRYCPEQVTKRLALLIALLASD